MTRYRTIVADPPWQITMKMGAGGRRARATEVPYGMMSLDEIKSLPVARLAADEAHLYLWTTRKLFREGDAAAVARAWGFEPCGEIIWGLRNPGMGGFNGSGLLGRPIARHCRAWGRGMTQNGRTLALLRARGAEGITAADFDPGPDGHVADGGPRFTRLAARIRDLRDSGWRIAKVDDPAGRFARYVLVSTPPEHREPDRHGWYREWQCWHPTGPGRVCGAHLHGPIGETCPRGHRAQLADVLDTTTPSHAEEEAA